MVPLELAKKRKNRNHFVLHVPCYGHMNVNHIKEVTYVQLKVSYTVSWFLFKNLHPDENVVKQVFFSIYSNLYTTITPISASAGFQIR